MDIDQLRSMGLVHSHPLLRREIKVRYYPLLPKEQWANPDIEERQAESVEDTVTFWLRGLTAADQIAVAAANNAGRDPFYTLIYRCVFNEKGERVFQSEEEALGVDLAMFGGLVVELNKLSDTAKKNSRRKMSSGANSPSASVDEA